MKIIFHNIYDSLNQNDRMFNDNNSLIGDNLLKPFVDLKKHAAQKGILLGTHYSINISQADAIVFIEIPKFSDRVFVEAHKMGIPVYVILFESELILPRNWDKSNHRYFKKIFTWNDDLVDNEKYFKINFSCDFPDHLQKSFNNKKLCTLIAGNKKVPAKNELYSERVKAINWFETNAPNDFDLYGIGWDKYYFSGPLKKLNRFGFLRSMVLYKTPKVYKGLVDRKFDVLPKYKFSICFENIAGLKGYITEKIFDCMLNSNIPVYWGAPNITDHIPQNCFINFQDFSSYEELYHFLRNMPEQKYYEYLNNIEDYFQSKKSYPFSIKYFSETVLREISE